MCLIFNAKKKVFKTYKKTRKSVTFINIQTYESDTRRSLIQIRLSVTIKKYKEVPLSAKGCTHSSRYLHHSKYKMFEKAPKKGSSLLPLNHVTVD